MERNNFFDRNVYAVFNGEIHFYELADVGF